MQIAPRTCATALQPTASYRWPQAVFGLLHVALTAPMIYLALGLPLLMRQHGWSGLSIGLFQLAGLPALCKVLLALPIERTRAEGHGLARYRRWAVLLGAGYGVALMLLALLDMDADKALLFALLMACVLLSTWIDVPVSALSIGVLPPAERVRAGGVRSAAMFVAAILGGGLMLVLAQRLGWAWPFVLMTALLALALALLPTVKMPAAQDPGKQAHTEQMPAAPDRPASGGLPGFFRQPDVGRWLVLLTGYFPFVGVAWVYLKPMLLDQGFAATQVAWVVGMGGGTLGAAASLAVAQLLRHERLSYCLPLSAWGNAAVLGLLALAMALRAPAPWLIAICMVLAVAVGVASSLVFGLMMDYARPAHRAVDYGVQASFYALGRLALMPIAGWLLDRSGNAGLLLALSVPALIVAALAWHWRPRPAQSS
ncbi:MAG: MFS transporter [Pseudomonadota bacterium]|nr:MFS transporter [Pseudomonadota bacterium]